MVSEFMRLNFPDDEHLTRVRVGPLVSQGSGMDLSEDEVAILQVHNRWADGIAILKDRVILVEAKIRPRMGPLEGLLLYSRLLPLTPELAHIRTLPIEKWFVYAIEDPVLNSIARDLGIRTVKYTPPWLPGYLKILQPRERRASSSGREVVS